MNVETKSLCVGVVVICLALVYLALVFWRFEWLLRFSLARGLLRWGRGNWSYPASKMGAFVGGVLVLVWGGTITDRYFNLLPRALWGVIFLSVLPFVVAAAIYDYRMRKETAKLHESYAPIWKDDEDDEA